MGFGLVFILSLKPRRQDQQNCSAWDCTSLCCTKNQNTELGHTVPSPIWKACLLEKAEKHKLFSQMLQTSNEPKASNPQHPLATPQLYQHTITQSLHAQQGGCASSAQSCAVLLWVQICTSCGPSATAIQARTASPHVVLQCLSPARPQHPPSSFCVLLPCDSAEVRPPAAVSMPDPTYHRSPTVLHVDVSSSCVFLGLASCLNNSY